MVAQGRREQKQAETRQRLTRAAQRLFAERGFDQTTVDAIAEAAGVSRRTFFHYFASKEDVVLARHADLEARLVAAVRTAPREARLLTVAHDAMFGVLDVVDAEELRVLAQLKRDTPVLRARDQGKYERLERALADALAERSGTAPDDLRVRLEAMLVAGLVRVGSDGWPAAAAAGVPAHAYVARVVDALDADLRPSAPSDATGQAADGATR